MKSLSPLSQKILLFLLAGAALSFSYSPRHPWKILKSASKEWKRISNEELRNEIRKLYQSKTISKKENDDGSVSILLTNKGKIKALKYNFDKITIDRKNWDGKWRLVIFDIPEKIKKSRDALRWKIKELGFYELQKSVFVFPYQCEDEINFVIEYYNLRKYVRFGTLNAIDNEIHLKKIFNIV
ncbi:MAG: hypothetical protein AAB361_00955 [Patescibacteria group bacterium]